MTLRVSFSSSRHINVCLNSIRLVLFAPQYASLFARCKSLLKKVFSFLQFVRYQFKSCLHDIVRTIARSRGTIISLVVSVFWLCNLVGWQGTRPSLLKKLLSKSKRSLGDSFQFSPFLVERDRGSKPLRLPYLAFLSSAPSFLRFLSLFLSRLILKYLFTNCCVNPHSFPRPPSVSFWLFILPSSRPFVPHIFFVRRSVVRTELVFFFSVFCPYINSFENPFRMLVRSGTDSAASPLPLSIWISLVRYQPCYLYVSSCIDLSQSSLIYFLLVLFTLFNTPVRTCKSLLRTFLCCSVRTLLVLVLLSFYTTYVSLFGSINYFSLLTHFAFVAEYLKWQSCPVNIFLHQFVKTKYGINLQQKKIYSFLCKSLSSHNIFLYDSPFVRYQSCLIDDSPYVRLSVQYWTPKAQVLMATGSPSQAEFTVNTSFIPGLARGILSTDPLYNNFLLPSPTGDSCGDGIVLHLLKGTP